MVLFMSSQFEGPGENELAPSGWVRLGEGVAPVLEARLQPIAPLEDRRTVTRPERRGPGRRRVLRIAAATRKKGGGGRGDLGKDLGVPIGEVGRAGRRIALGGCRSDVRTQCSGNRHLGLVAEGGVCFLRGPHHAVRENHSMVQPVGQCLPRRLRPTVHEAQVPKVHQLAVPGWSRDVSSAARSE